MRLTSRINLASKGFEAPLSLDVELDGVTAVFGPSGCGKTSLLRAIAGLDRHSDTSIYFGDETWQNDTEFLPVHQRGLSYVFQEASLFDHLSVEENLDYALQRSRSGKEDVVDKHEISRHLNITPLLGRSCRTLSGGECQRVAIARALCAQPRLLLMDEPLSALDAAHKSEIIPLLESLCRSSSVPIIYVSHSIDEVARFADRLVLMRNGGVIAHGQIADVLSQLDLPIAQQADAAAILDGRVMSHEQKYGLTYISTPAGRLCITHAEHLDVGVMVRVKLCARDVSIALERAQNSSILNTITATVSDMRAHDKAQVLVQLNAGGERLLAKITKKSQHALGLELGQEVVAQVKSVALL